MADIETWTKAARQKHNNSVLIAVPASSRPWQEEGASAGYSLEAVSAGPLAAAFAAVFLGVSAAVGGVRRVLQRNKRVGDRDVNDRVAILFYEDRADVHRRPILRTDIGELLETHPLDAVGRPEHDKLIIDGTTWTLFGARSRELTTALRESAVDIRQG